MKKSDEHFMSRACELAKRGLGKTSPNPPVGAVVVKNDEIISEGYHIKSGLDHAEVIAIREAKERAKGATLYVTLEPCCHTGKTPPCTKAIMESGISKVCVGSIDPDQRVDGNGIVALKNAGIAVDVMDEYEPCAALIRPYKKFKERYLPFVTMKAAISLDGKIALEDGTSKWITNESCRRYVHKIRSEHDAVMVGFGTVLADNPRLNVRLDDDDLSQPRAIVIDERLKISMECNLYNRKAGELIIATTKNAPPEKFDKLVAKGFDLITLQEDDRGYIDLMELFSQLAQKEIVSVMVEGGATLFSELINENLVDRVVACISPKFLGGKSIDLMPTLDVVDIASAPMLNNIKLLEFDGDVVLEGHF
ncbi:MAG: bifunctional diaminohydroxyphosphoribosylaminopyrimidine deaminase/5-amino-6-(5-phosphoribosylamino)uracil reductase RibD [Pseudomonadota bacterium]